MRERVNGFKREELICLGVRVAYEVEVKRKIDP